MEAAEGQRLHIGQRLGELLLRLAGEAGDEVGAEVQIGDGGAGLIGQGAEGGAGRAPGHAAQHAVAARLQR